MKMYYRIIYTYIFVRVLAQQSSHQHLNVSKLWLLALSRLLALVHFAIVALLQVFVHGVPQVLGAGEVGPNLSHLGGDLLPGTVPLDGGDGGGQPSEEEVLALDEELQKLELLGLSQSHGRSPFG